MYITVGTEDEMYVFPDHGILIRDMPDHDDCCIMWVHGVRHELFLPKKDVLNEINAKLHELNDPGTDTAVVALNAQLEGLTRRATALKHERDACSRSLHDLFCSIRHIEDLKGPKKKNAQSRILDGMLMKINELQARGIVSQVIMAK